ncbi:MAG: hypothetical protein IPK26_13830 [Planctomycetes bacterium]|nr:hypothetical protein [Planctomycetota bacterium]
MRIVRLALVPVFAAPLLAQLPAPTLTSRTAPRAAWTAVTSAGTTTSGPLSGGAYTPTPNTSFRADTCGAASADKIWVFGGSLGNNTATTTNDLWAFDAVAGSFTQLLPDASPGAPPARGNHCVAWNPLTSKLVVFGGNTRGATPTLLNDTWEYDPTTNAWTQVMTATSPTPRQFAAMAFDPNTGGMLLFGGQTSLPPTTTPPTPPAISGETWVLSGTNWTLMTPPMSPPARSQHSLCTRADSFFDVLLCCGMDNSTLNGTGTALEQNRFLDVWTWNGAWTLLSDCDVVANPTGIGTTWPASVLGNQAVYDALRRRVVVQGGNGITIASNTTWIYGPNYGGSPSNYTSEFDCLTNSWEIYANPTTGATPFNNNDSVIGRVSRYFGGFVPATGKVYKICGQTPASTGSRPLYNVYEYQANPVAASVVNGTGCAATAGVMNLSAANAPWTGRQFQSSCTGFAATSLGFGVFGFAPQSVPLAALHPAGLAGCNLLATADATSLLLPSGGSVGFGFAVPAGTMFAGLPLELQVLQVEVDGSFAITSIVGSNSLSLTVGAL